jgi:glycosyltransferase involved in cell wall biosynthesis
MISRHYWPHFSFDTACRDVRLADALARSGTEIEVLTPRYAAAWPDRIAHREIIVHRPVAAARGSWSIGRYLKHLENWISENAHRFDILFCTQCGDEVIPMMAAVAPKSVRRVVLHSGTAAAADYLTWPAMRTGRRIRAYLDRADAVVVSWASTRRELLAMGVAKNRVHRIDLGVSTPGSDVTLPDGDAVRSSRQSLTHANGDLSLHHDSHVVMACGQMGLSGGMMTLAQTAPSLIDVWPDLRFWFIGDGPQRDAMHTFFRHQSVRQNVAMPGTFVDFEDLFRVADLFVVPSPADSLEDLLPAAVGAELPVVVADSPDTRSFFSGFEQSVVWFRAGDVDQLRSAIRSALVDLPARRAAARSLRREMLRLRPYQATVQGYKQLFDSLVPPVNRLRVEPISKIGPDR